MKWFLPTFLTSSWSTILRYRCTARQGAGSKSAPDVAPSPFLVLIALLCSPVTGPLPVFAQNTPERPLDVVLALDNSGSMKSNDPQRMMQPAVSTFARRLPQDTRLGLVVFDTTARLALSLSSVAGAGFTTKFQNAMDHIDYKGQWTDIPGAVERSLYELRDHGRRGSRRVVVLFTDGFVDLGDTERNRVRTDWLFSDLVDEAKREDVAAMVFGIAFTEGADFALIQSLSAKTGGTHFRILSASDMPKVFEQVTDQIRQLRPESADQPPQIPTSTGTSTGAPLGNFSIPLRWALLGLVLAGAAAGLRVLWLRHSAPPVPGTFQDCLEKTRVYSIDKRSFRIGRVRYKGLRRNDIVISQKTIGRSHAQIRFRGGDFYIQDDGSVNHTYLNGKMVSQGRPEKLENGDIIRFDAFEFRFGAVEKALMRKVARGATEEAPDRIEGAAVADVEKTPQAVRSPYVAVPRPRRVDTLPPSGYVENAGPGGEDAVPSGSGAHGSAETPTEKCLRCDRLFLPAQMTSWCGCRVCRECETIALSLPTGQAESLKKELETKGRRRAHTVEMA